MPRSSNRSPFGEVLIVLTVLIGFFWLFDQGKVSLAHVWTYVGFLIGIVIFYFALLICRIAFFHATGGNGELPWWTQVDTQHYKKPEKRS